MDMDFCVFTCAGRGSGGWNDRRYDRDTNDKSRLLIFFIFVVFAFVLGLIITDLTTIRHFFILVSFGIFGVAPGSGLVLVGSRRLMDLCLTLCLLRLLLLLLPSCFATPYVPLGAKEHADPSFG